MNLQLSRRRLGAVALALVATACGHSTATVTVVHDTGAAASASPGGGTKTASGTTTTVALPVGKPSRIVSLSPSATEMLFAIGAGPQVVAVDSDSNFPAQAPKTTLSAYQPNVEAIAAYRPDLVITDGTNPQLLSQLNALHIATLAAPAPTALSGVFTQIEQIGAVTGNIATAGALATSLQQRAASIVASFPKPTIPVRYYYELDNTYYSATSHTFIGAVLGSLGLSNIADSADTTKSAGYPQLTPEFIVKANPDVILLADTKCCQQSVQTVAARPGWNVLTAVAQHRVIALDDDVASRWGPRIVDLLQQVATALRSVQGTTGGA